MTLSKSLTAFVITAFYVFTACAAAQDQESPLDAWIYPNAHSNNNGHAKTGQGEFAAAGGIYWTAATFSDVFTFYAKLAEVPDDAGILKTNRGRWWKIWADSPVKTMITRDITSHHSHASFLFQHPGKHTVSVSIVRSNGSKKTRIAVSLLSEFYRNDVGDEDRGDPPAATAGLERIGEQSNARERRSDADEQLTINRRRPVMRDVIRQSHHA